MMLGPYRLVSRIGAGGMGEVWRAEDPHLLRPVAVKVLPSWVSADSEAKERFLREARTAAQLNHPYITTVYGAGEDEGTMYIAMELVEGELLSSAIGRLEPKEVVRIIRQTAEGLASAHERSIIHRDVKPDNVIVQPSRVKILDFGIAKEVGPAATGNLTAAGFILGTPFYMSPEQALGHALDARSDLFSLGIVLFEALTGKRPFEGTAPTETLLQIISTATPDVRAHVSNIPSDLVAIVTKALQKRLEDRFQSAEEFAAALATVSWSAEIRPVLSNRRALVADVDDATRACLRDVLAADGIVCDEVRNGADAVCLLKKNAYELVFVDLFLPRIDGWGVVDFIHRRDLAKATRVYVIASGNVSRLSQVDRETICGVLGKPLDSTRVAEEIHRGACHA